MTRIGFIGVPGAGKTTMARAVAGFIRAHTKYKTVELVSEYARQYIHKYGIDSLHDQMRIYKKQLEEENRYPDTTEVIITDSPIFLGLGYSIELRTEGLPKHTMIINDLFKEMNKLNEVPRYDIIFHLPPKLKPIRDGVRGEHQFDQGWRNEMDKKLLSIFYIFPPRKLITINSTDINDRIKECMDHINAYGNSGSNQLLSDTVPKED